MKDKDSQLIFEAYITENFKPAPGSALDGMLDPEDLGLDADLNPLEDWDEHYMSHDLDAIQELVDHLRDNYIEDRHYRLHVGYGDDLPNTIDINNDLGQELMNTNTQELSLLAQLLDGASEEPEGEGDEEEPDDHDPNPWA